MKPLTIKVAMSPEELLRRMDAKQKRVLFKQGAYTRTAMQRSMRYTSKPDKHSAPGKPPLAHKNGKRGPLLRKLIKFKVDLTETSVITGPEGDRGSDVPPVLDKGGRVKRGLLKVHDFEPGEYGPIRRRDVKSFHRIMLETPRQCARATRLVAEENALRQSAAAYIKPRPFTAPVLTDGGENLRKLIAREPL